eukprot:4571908-Pleurochrysis_carterae.AAC.1
MRRGNQGSAARRRRAQEEDKSPPRGSPCRSHKANSRLPLPFVYRPVDCANQRVDNLGAHS